jgi:hypothetical protein
MVIVILKFPILFLSSCLLQLLEVYRLNMYWMKRRPITMQRMPLERDIGSRKALLLVGVLSLG